MDAIELMRKLVAIESINPGGNEPAFGDVPTIILGPGETHMAHQTDEFCLVERIPIAVEIYKTLIEDWATSDLSGISI